MTVARVSAPVPLAERCSGFGRSADFSGCPGAQHRLYFRPLPHGHGSLGRVLTMTSSLIAPAREQARCGARSTPPLSSIRGGVAGAEKVGQMRLSRVPMGRSGAVTVLTSAQATRH